MKISYSFGMVDLMHFGHINAIRKASQDADLNIFGVVSDEASNAWFGTHTSSEDERRTVLESIKYIDEVWEQETFDPLDNLRKIHSIYPESTISLFTGNEWGIIAARKYLESIGGKVVKLKYYDRLSPQAILDTLNRNNIKEKPLNNNLISTKADTLLALKRVLTKAKIEEIVIITVGEYRENSKRVITNIRRTFSSGHIVVRSSSKHEDAFEESNAGHFASVLHVDVMDTAEIERAISIVISSYGENIEADEQILIQRQTDDVLVSGVIFTRDIQRNRPYYVINYDDSGSTDAVTSGISSTSAWLSCSVSKDSVPDKWKGLMDAVWELEDILPGILLDIEFAITLNAVVIFQVRPLAAAYKFGRNNNDELVKETNKGIVRKYQNYSQLGLTCFSDMAFWNPSEIIGDNPKNLDFSLYREIITRKAWDAGLIPLGYRPVLEELMYRFGNKPYISVERSFEALIPMELSDNLALKLRNYYVKSLKKDLSAHDKIEFEISHNCYNFSTHKSLAALAENGFTATEILKIESALRSLTERIIVNYSEILDTDLLNLKRLEGIRLDIQNITEGCNDFRMLAKSIHTLLDAINKFGTPQFSRHARCAFIAKAICYSLISEGYISSEQYNQFMSSIKTVAVSYDKDYHLVLNGKMKKDEFNSIYGHLRAGTYNIRSPRYDQMEQLFSETKDKVLALEQNNLINNDIIMCNAIERGLKDAGIDCLSGKQIVFYTKKAIEQREYFKFIFTKSLSLAIELIKKLGTIVGIDEKSLSYLELAEIYSSEYYSDVERLREFWKLIVDRRRELYKINSEMILPAVICGEQDFAYVENIDCRPNYITENKVTGNVAVLDNETEDIVDGKVVVIEKADPGYDWIFSKGIVGLVTKYGGAASHMAIRCAEFMIPAAIGCGAKWYEYAANSKKLTIDCKNERLIREE